MKFGKIDYLNLLPFSLYLKKNIKHSSYKQICKYRSGVPSAINKMFKRKIVDAGFISSIESFTYPCSNLGIIAKKEVLSVLVIKGEKKEDSASATSNALASLLNIDGEVVIGDRALRLYYDNIDAIDLSSQWSKETGLPFVFARLCFHKKLSKIKKIENDFLKNIPKIPYYILKEYSKKTGISIGGIKNYLSKISYKIGYKEQKSLKLFRSSINVIK